MNWNELVYKLAFGYNMHRALNNYESYVLLLVGYVNNVDKRPTVVKPLFHEYRPSPTRFCAAHGINI